MLRKDVAIENSFPIVKFFNELRRDRVRDFFFLMTNQKSNALTRISQNKPTVKLMTHFKLINFMKRQRS